MSYRKKHASTLSVLLLGAVVCLAGQMSFAQNCVPGPGERIHTITLQNGANSMEPVAEPTRIRVDDRSTVHLCLTNVSPVDVCSLSGRTPTPTTETNPIESLVTSIAGLGGFAINFKPSASLGLTEFALTLQREMAHINTSPEAERRTNRVLADPKYKKFIDMATKFNDLALRVIDSQNTMQLSLADDPNRLATYLGADYRGTRWQLFHPENDPDLQPIRDDFTNALSTLTNTALMQPMVDTLTKLATEVHTTYDPNATAEEADTLSQMDEKLAKTKAVMSVINDNNTALKAAQATVRTGYLAVVKVYKDFRRRLDVLGTLRISANGNFLFQDFRLGTDRKATVTGVLSCVSDADAKPTTDQINYSILYQDVPRLTSSAGFLVSSLEKKVIGTTTVAANNSAGFNTNFTVTDRSQAQVLPMVYANYRVLGYNSKHWPKREDELVLTASLSTGFGLNPNTGTAQPEFFTGLAFGFNRLMIHPGIHFGRTQSLGGGFVLNSTVPATFSGNAPTSWSYHPAFSIGFSVRVAPY